jgi:hypothetical protein
METWQKCIGYEGLYLVSNMGNVFSIRKNRLRKLVIHKKGYAQVMLSNSDGLKLKLVHRLIYQSFKGLTDLEIDHINSIKDDNRLVNLRACTRRENEHFKLRDNKTSKFLGVRKFRNKWRAHIGVNGEKLHLGTFKTELEASFAYQNKLKTIKLNGNS